MDGTIPATTRTASQNLDVNGARADDARALWAMHEAADFAQYRGEQPCPDCTLVNLHPAQHPVCPTCGGTKIDPGVPSETLAEQAEHARAAVEAAIGEISSLMARVQVTLAQQQDALTANASPETEEIPAVVVDLVGALHSGEYGPLLALVHGFVEDIRAAYPDDDGREPVSPFTRITLTGKAIGGAR